MAVAWHLYGTLWTVDFAASFTLKPPRLRSMTSPLLAHLAKANRRHLRYLWLRPTLLACHTFAAARPVTTSHVGPHVLRVSTCRTEVTWVVTRPGPLPKTLSQLCQMNTFGWVNVYATHNCWQSTVQQTVS